MPTATNLNQQLDEHLCELLGTSLLVSDGGDNAPRVRDLTLFTPSRRPDHAFELIALLAARGIMITVSEATVSVGATIIPRGSEPLTLTIVRAATMALRVSTNSPPNAATADRATG